MKVEQQVYRQNRLTPFAIIGRIVAFAFAILAVCALTKPFAYGYGYENCQCPSEDQSAECSNQVKPTISA